MLRAPKLLLSCLVFALFLSNSQATPTRLATYTIAATAVGYGAPIAVAEIDAFAEMWEQIGVIEGGLPKGHEIIGIVIDSQGPINSTTYQIHFHVIVQWGVQGEDN